MLNVLTRIPLLNSPKKRQWAFGLLIFFVIAFLLTWLLQYIANNLENRHIRSGFSFLNDVAGFDISETPFIFSSSDSLLKAFTIGFYNTIKISFLSIISASVLGFIVALMKLSEHPFIRFLGVAHVEFYRNIPLVVILLGLYLAVTHILPDSFSPLIFFGCLVNKSGLYLPVPSHLGYLFSVFLLLSLIFRGGYLHLPQKFRNCSKFSITIVCVLITLLTVTSWINYFGYTTPQQDGFSVSGGQYFSIEFLVLWLGLTLFSSASVAELIRAGILSVKKDQWHSGFALGLTYTQNLFFVIMPQAFKLIIPPMASQYMNIIKNSSLAVVVGYPDIVNIGNTAINITAQAIEIILIIMTVYLLLNLLTAMVMNYLNSHVLNQSRK